MRAYLILFFLLACHGGGLAQQTLFYDDFSYADSQVKKNLNTLREDRWKLSLYGYTTCHAVNLPGTGGIAYAVQLDEGPIDDTPPGLQVQCDAETQQLFTIDPYSIYTNTLKFRINDYSAFYSLLNGFRSESDRGPLQVTPVLQKDVARNVDQLLMTVTGPGIVGRYTATDLDLRPFAGQWLTLKTEINTQSDDSVTVVSSLLDESDQPVRVINIVLSDPMEIGVVLGQSFNVVFHPANFLTRSQRVLDVKEVGLTRR